MKKKPNAKVEAMIKRSLIIESERTNYERKFTLNEDTTTLPNKIQYNKCEGGEGVIDPNSYKLNEIAPKDEEGNPIIVFINEPNMGWQKQNNSESIYVCLGEEKPFKGKCYNVIDGIATYPMDCKTGKSLW